MQLPAKGKILITVALASLLTSALVAPSQASTTNSDRTIIALPRESQAIPKRPTLEAIKRTAKQQNISLADAIDAHVAHAVATNPSVTARARADGLDPAVVEPEMKIDDLWVSELTDMKVAAKGNNITLEEAIETIAWQPRLNEVGAKLKERYPTELSGLAVLEDGRKAQIGFKGEIPADAIELAKTLPVSVELVGNKGFSEEDLEEARDAAYAQVNARRDLVETLTGSYDTDTGVVTITIKPHAMPRGVAAQKAVSAQLQPAQPANKKISVSLRFTEDDLMVPHDKYMRGGGVLGGCTTGFNIINQNYPSDPDQRRTTTAEHCGRGPANYANHPTQAGFTPLTDYASGSSTYDIAAWTRGDFTVTRTFYYDLNHARYAYYIGTSPARNQNICNFGWATNEAKCANIAQINVDGGAGTKGLIVMDRNINLKGDSGGPWYKGNTAWGIHTGTINGNSAFTPAYLIPSALGASWKVWTAPPGT
ncbi:hypothetical protein [Nonomuraea sp. SYSU D8015]|uniref:hypothetical protein n=1 Tax=Nonomuraea sp. SYSU D8015 TaxID=2593644 RepID=UPI00166072EE|nr:hypothetical protein [Nonomuraea sp. SYSU D8015]